METSMSLYGENIMAVRESNDQTKDRLTFPSKDPDLKTSQKKTEKILPKKKKDSC